MMHDPRWCDFDVALFVAVSFAVGLLLGAVVM